MNTPGFRRATGKPVALPFWAFSPPMQYLFALTGENARIF